MPRGGVGYLGGGYARLNPQYQSYIGTRFGGAGDYARANQPFAYGNWAGEGARNTAVYNYGAFPAGMYASGAISPRAWYQVGNPATGRNTWIQALDVSPRGVIDMSPGANALIGGTGRDPVNLLGGLPASGGGANYPIPGAGGVAAGNWAANARRGINPGMLASGGGLSGLAAGSSFGGAISYGLPSFSGFGPIGGSGYQRYLA